MRASLISTGFMRRLVTPASRAAESSHRSVAGDRLVGHERVSQFVSWHTRGPHIRFATDAPGRPRAARLSRFERRTSRTHARLPAAVMFVALVISRQANLLATQITIRREWRSLVVFEECNRSATHLLVRLASVLRVCRTFGRPRLVRIRFITCSPRLECCSTFFWKGSRPEPYRKSIIARTYFAAISARRELCTWNTRSRNKTKERPCSKKVQSIAGQYSARTCQ